MLPRRRLVLIRRSDDWLSCFLHSVGKVGSSQLSVDRHIWKCLCRIVTREPWPSFSGVSLRVGETSGCLGFQGPSRAANLQHGRVLLNWADASLLFNSYHLELNLTGGHCDSRVLTKYNKPGDKKKRVSITGNKDCVCVCVGVCFRVWVCIHLKKPHSDLLERWLSLPGLFALVHTPTENTHSALSARALVDALTSMCMCTTLTLDPWPVVWFQAIHCVHVYVCAGQMC